MSKNNILTHASMFANHGINRTPEARHTIHSFPSPSMIPHPENPPEHRKTGKNKDDREGSTHELLALEEPVGDELPRPDRAAFLRHDRLPLASCRQKKVITHHAPPHPDSNVQTLPISVPRDAPPTFILHNQYPPLIPHLAIITLPPRIKFPATPQFQCRTGVLEMPKRGLKSWGMTPSMEGWCVEEGGVYETRRRHPFITSTVEGGKRGVSKRGS
eukprot:754308-Hanusia_phi.AAC.2